MASFSKIKEGDLLWDCFKRRQGNTTIKAMVCLPVRVIEVHEGYALCTWNGNKAEKFYHARIEKLRRTKIAK